MDNRNDPSLIDEAVAEIKGMAKGGMAHPSTKPVLTGAALGVVVAAVTPLTWPIAALGGAAIAFYTRIKK